MDIKAIISAVGEAVPIVVGVIFIGQWLKSVFIWLKSKNNNNEEEIIKSNDATTATTPDTEEAILDFLAFFALLFSLFFPLFLAIFIIQIPLMATIHRLKRKERDSKVLSRFMEYLFHDVFFSAISITACLTYNNTNSLFSNGILRLFQ